MYSSESDYNSDDSIDSTDSDLDLDLDLELDTSWVEEFKNINLFEKVFCLETVTTVNLSFLYINKKREIKHVQKDVIDLSNSEISSDVMVSKIKYNSTLNKRKYSLYKILKYNINIKPRELISLLSDKIDPSEFLTTENIYKNIYFEDTITVLQNSNSIYVFMLDNYENNDDSNSDNDSTDDSNDDNNDDSNDDNNDDNTDDSDSDSDSDSDEDREKLIILPNNK